MTDWVSHLARQVAYFGFGAGLQVRDLASGNVVYREVLVLAHIMPSPHVVIRDGDGRLPPCHGRRAAGGWKLLTS
jgi:hypothetical protein